MPQVFEQSLFLLHVVSHEPVIKKSSSVQDFFIIDSSLVSEKKSLESVLEMQDLLVEKIKGIVQFHVLLAVLARSSAWACCQTSFPSPHLDLPVWFMSNPFNSNSNFIASPHLYFPILFISNHTWAPTFCQKWERLNLKIIYPKI